MSGRISILFLLILGLYGCFQTMYVSDLSRSYDSIKKQDVVSMTREYRSVEWQRETISQWRYLLNIQWSKVLNGSNNLKGVLTLIEPQVIIPDIQDTLFISLQDGVIRAPFSDFTTTIERQGTETITERKRHQAIIELSSEDQSRILKEGSISFRLYAQNHTYTFPLNLKEQRLLRSICNQ